MKKSKRVFVAFLIVVLSMGFSPYAFALPDSDRPGNRTFEEGLNYVLAKYGVKVQGVASRLSMISYGSCTAQEFKFQLDYYNEMLPSAIEESIVEGSFTGQLERYLDNFAKGTPEYDSNTQTYRIKDAVSGSWFSDSSGRFPYCPKAEWDAYLSGGNVPAKYTAQSGHFVDTTVMDAAHPQILAKTILDDLQADLNKDGVICSMVKTPFDDGKGGSVIYYVLLRTASSGGTRGALFCNRQNQPFVAAYEPSAINQDFNFTQQVVIDTIDQSTNNTENKIDLSRPIDLSNGTFYFIDENGDKITQNIDSVNFNFDDRSYTVNTYDYTYNITNNYYEFNYYTYNVQYTYNNTYVTYIGATAEYQPVEYELYYELPDGRSSADLTEADASSLSFQFHDVLNYKRSAIDVTLRALYHFDGDTDDVSFFARDNSFVWNSGASLTYMESNAFNGALYLDEKTHQFTLNLPSSLGSKDFTIQWRYYQNSATTSTNNSNYVMLGSTKVFSWSEQSLYSMGSTKLSTGLSVGTWQELAIVRSENTLYFYHNGLKVGSASNSTAFGNQIVFYFGAGRAYSMIDELRVTNFAIAKSGASYTPTTVPYDTNSVLVLPDSATPVADEYWAINKTGNKLSAVSDFSVSGNRPVYYALNGVTASYGSESVVVYNGGTYVLPTDSSVYNNMASSPTGCGLSCYAILAGNLQTSGWGKGDSSAMYTGSTYTFSVLDVDGNVYSVTGKLPSAYTNISPSNGSSSWCSYKTFSWGYLSFLYARNGPGFSIQLLVVPKAGKSIELLYAELKAGSTPNKHEHITAIYDGAKLEPNTAAIQSDIPVNNYTVGGVRPTFPARGDVWFAVENHRISGVQIYNGHAWEAVNARWWTGSRWIPIHAFDMVTLADMWDVNGSDGDKLQPTITSEYAFWNWWQKEWTSFRTWLTSIWGDGSSGSGPGGSGSSSSGGSFLDKLKDTIGNGLLVLIEGLFALVITVLEAIIRMVIDLLSFIFGFITETVIGGIASFFSSFTDGTLFDAFKVEGPEGEITAELPEGIATVFAFFSGVILALPGELRGLLIFGVAALILLSVFKFVKS